MIFVNKTKIQKIILFIVAIIVIAQFEGPYNGFSKSVGFTVNSSVNNIGVSTHFTVPREGEIDMIKKTGFNWIRTDLYWDNIETKRGVYDFLKYDILMNDLQKNHIRPIFILVYSNPLYDNGLSPHTDTGRAAFTKWAIVCAKHFKNKGVLWEFYNEPDGGGWSPKPNMEDYLKLALIVAKSFKSIVPSEVLIGPAISSSNALPFLVPCFRAGLLNYWSAISVHPYRKGIPEEVLVDYSTLKQILNYYPQPKGGTPIISGEWGYPSSSWRPIRDVILNENIQAKYLSRMFLVNILSKISLSIWYDWQNDALDSRNPENNFGITYYTSEKFKASQKHKPAYYAAHTLSDFLVGYQFKYRLKTQDSSDYVLFFTNSIGKTRIAAWTTKKSSHLISLKLNIGKYQIISNTGAKTNHALANHSDFDLNISDSPQYVISQ